MKSLNSYYINEAIQQNISDFQKGLLASILQSATPEQAYQTAIGAQNSVAALQQLQRMNYIVIRGTEVNITSIGRQAAIQNNLIDNTGMLTDEGKHQVDEFIKNKNEYINSN